MNNTEESMRLLEEYHEFPGSYTFKIIGPNYPEWFNQIKAAAESVLGDIGDSLKPSASSKNMRYMSLSLEVHVKSSAQVLEVYDVLKKVPDVKMLI